MEGEKVPLRAWRRVRLLSMRDLASLSGVALSTIARIEAGHPVRPSTLRKLATALGVSGEELLAGPGMI
jgi:transcriptional regulator with XRE-family HTH domain